MNIESTQLKEILSAHLQKEEKVDIYQPRVEANLINGHPTFKATWSWWAFVGTWAFFLYRKMYLMAAIFFLVSIFLSFIPLGGLLLMIVSGVSGFYFYTKKLTNDLEIVGLNERPIEEVKENLKKLGGYNSWVVWVAAIFYSLIILFILAGFLGM